MFSITAQRVRSSEDALVWMTDCTLATVQDLAFRFRPPKAELRRQISIAQHGVDWIKVMGISPSGRAADVIASGGSVEEWVRQG